MMKNKKQSRPSTSWITLEFQPLKECENVMLRGAWDDWQGSAMHKKKNGAFYVRKKIPLGAWECGFDCNDSIWQINPDIQTTPSPFGSLNNIITVR